MSVPDVTFFFLKSDLSTVFNLYSDRQARANSVDSDEMPQNAMSHHGLHCLPLIQQFLHTTSGSFFYVLV